jgi:hypothetical protein
MSRRLPRRQAEEPACAIFVDRALYAMRNRIEQCMPCRDPIQSYCYQFPRLRQDRAFRRGIVTQFVCVLSSVYIAGPSAISERTAWRLPYSAGSARARPHESGQADVSDRKGLRWRSVYGYLYLERPFVLADAGGMRFARGLHLAVGKAVTA